MTTTGRPLPRHGTQYRYKGARNGSFPPCRCPKCIRAHSQGCARRALAHLAGQPPLYPGEPLREHIRTCMEAGMSQTLIARRANVAQSTIGYLRRGLTNSCQRDKALRILAVTPGDFDAVAERPALGTMRRTRAMYALGHNPETISAASGLDQSTISHIANGRYKTVAGTTAAAIAAAYRILSIQRGTSSKARQRASVEGWFGPLAWDGNIDAPNAQPDTTEAPEPELKRNERAEQRRDEIWLLHTARLADEEIAARVGMHPSTVREIRAELRTGRKRNRGTKQDQAVAA